MRKVKYSEYVRNEETKFLALKEIGVATFHAFGFDYEDTECGPGNYSTAIIELDDGTIKNLPVEQVTFIKE